MHCSVQDTEVVQGLVAQARIVGGVLAMAMFNSTFNRQLIAHLHGELAVEQIVQVQADSKALGRLSPLHRFQARRTFASSFTEGLASCAVAAVLGLLVSSVIARERGPDLQSRARKTERYLISYYKSQLLGR